MCNKKEVTSLHPKLTVTSFNLLGTNRLPIAPPISIVSIAQSREKVSIELYVPDSTVLGFSPSQVHRFHLSGISANLLVFESVCAAVRRLLSVCDGTRLPVHLGSPLLCRASTKHGIVLPCSLQWRDFSVQLLTQALIF